MIATECEKLRDLLKGLENAKTNERIVNALNERRKDLKDVCQKSLASFNSFEAMNKRQVISGTPDGSRARKRIADLRTALSGDPESITKGRGLTDMINAMKKIADTLNDVTNEAWKDYLAKSKPKLDANQLGQARQIGTHRESVDRLEYWKKQADSLVRKPPLDEEAFAAIEALWQNMRKLMSSLPSPSDNPEVQAFLDAANSREGAPIELMTPDVLAWLKEQSMSQKFRIHQA